MRLPKSSCEGPRRSHCVVERHGGRTPPLRRRRLDLYFALCLMVYLEMGGEEPGRRCAQGMDEAQSSKKAVPRLMLPPRPSHAESSRGQSRWAKIESVQMGTQAIGELLAELLFPFLTK